MEVDFDPSQISFAKIVDLFWASHDPCGRLRGSQYMTAIWYHDEAQRDVINAARETIQQRLDGKVQTPVEALDVFYPAEDYHQKYRLQNSPLKACFRAMYPQFEDFNNSTAAARLNGFLARHGSRKLFDAEHQSYGIQSEVLEQNVRIRDLSGAVASCPTSGC